MNKSQSKLKGTMNEDNKKGFLLVHKEWNHVHKNYFVQHKIFYKSPNFDRKLQGHII